MKHYLLVTSFSMLAVFNAPECFAQKTLPGLGAIVFESFQQDSLQKLFALIPTTADVTAYANTVGLPIDSANVKAFEASYPTVISNYKKSCYAILKDTTKNHIHWKTASIASVETKPDDINAAGSEQDGIQASTSTIKIFFNSNNKLYVLELDYVNKYGDLWKPGNNIRLSEKDKAAAN